MVAGKAVKGKSITSEVSDYSLEERMRKDMWQSGLIDNGEWAREKKKPPQHCVDIDMVNTRKGFMCVGREGGPIRRIRAKCPPTVYLDAAAFHRKVALCDGRQGMS